MKTKRATWGLILLTVGLILLLENLDVLEFAWWPIFRMWPLIIIIIGVNYVLPRNRTGKSLSLLVGIVALGFVIYTGTEQGRGLVVELDDDDTQLTQAYSDSIEHAELAIHAAAAAFEIQSDTEDYLFIADAHMQFASHYLLAHFDGDTLTKVSYYMREPIENKVDIKLHRDPIWKITLKLGAGSADFDLEDFKLSEVNLHCGAARVTTKLGQPVGVVPVKVQGGASSIALHIPENAACKVILQTALSSSTIKGLTKQEDGTYQTDNFAESMDRFVITMKGGVSSFSVTR